MPSAPIVIEKYIPVNREKIWEDLTNPEQMKQWYFDIPDFKPEKGFQFSFTGGPPEKEYIHRCVIQEVIPGKLLTHTWRYEGYPGESVVSWQLEDSGDGTLLKLTHSGLETFPADNPDFARKNFEAGWDSILSTLASRG